MKAIFQILFWLTVAALDTGIELTGQQATGFTPSELQVVHKLRPNTGTATPAFRQTATDPAAIRASLGAPSRTVGGASATQMSSRSGQTQTPAGRNQSIATAQAPIAACRPAGIHDVNGQNIGAIFTPSTEYNGYVSGYKSNVSLIRGCGFGQSAGKVFIDPPFDPAPNPTSVLPNAAPGASQALQLRIVGGQWSDNSILVEVDPGTGGYLATQNANLRVVTSDNREYRAPGFKFYPIYETQHLPQLPRITRLLTPSANRSSLQARSNGDSFAQAKDANGNPVTPHYFSPSAGSVVFDSNHTFAVVRIAHASFGSGTDTFDITGALKEGFEMAETKISEVVLPGDSCKAPYSYQTSGAWNIHYASGQLQVSWQEQGCQWDRRAGNPQAPSSGKPSIAVAPAPVVSSLPNSNQVGTEGASAYAIDIVVRGPRGVSPLR